MQTRIERVGLVPAKVRAQVAMLGDAEITRLHAQVMNGNLLTARAGQSAADDVTTIILVVLISAALAGVLLYYLAAVKSNSYY